MAKRAITAKETRSLLEIIDCEQGSDEWRAARAGLPTASVFGTVMANGKDGGPSITRTKLLHRLAGEILTGEPSPDEYRNASMDRGNAMEAEARQAYAEKRGVEVRRVGFVKNFGGLKRAGCSPDGFCGFDGGVEIKTARPDVLIPMLLRGAGLPSEHRAQVMGNLWVAEREWFDLVVYWPKMPLYIVRVTRDESYIRDLSNEVEKFNFELTNLAEKLRRMM